MADEGRQVLVIDKDPGTAELVLTLLEDEGYVVHSLESSAGALTETRRRLPALLVIDLPPGELIQDECCHLLDALRADPVTRHIPVMVMTTAEPLAERAIASYNVRATITKPFDVENFLAMVLQALDLPLMAAAVPARTEEPHDLLKRAEEVLALRSREALLRWVRRLQKEEPWQSRTDLRLSELLDHTPVLVEAIHTAILFGQPDRLLAEHPDAMERVREHARMRRRQAIALETVLREYTHLRDELWGTIWCDLHGAVHSADVYYLQRIIAGTLDRIIEVTVQTYLHE